MTVSRTLLLLAGVVSAVCLLCAAAQTVAGPQSFDVASIHVNNTATDGHHHIFNDPAESRFRVANLALAI